MTSHDHLRLSAHHLMMMIYSTCSKAQKRVIGLILLYGSRDSVMVSTLTCWPGGHHFHFALSQNWKRKKNWPWLQVGPAYIGLRKKVTHRMPIGLGMLAPYAQYGEGMGRVPQLHIYSIFLKDAHTDFFVYLKTLQEQMIAPIKALFNIIKT